jgi:hypothetical protein
MITDSETPTDSGSHFGTYPATGHGGGAPMNVSQFIARY